MYYELFETADGARGEALAVADAGKGELAGIVMRKSKFGTIRLAIHHR